MHNDNLKDSPPNVFFECDNIIFKFPKYYLKDSLIFQRIFTNILLWDVAVKDAEHAKVSGNGTPQNPFSSMEVDRKSLESFLALRRTSIYDREPDIHGKDSWIAILKVSYFWKMEKLGKFAVGQLSKIPLEGVEKLKLAKRYDIQDKEWKLSAIRELIKTDMIFPDIDVQEVISLKAAPQVRFAKDIPVVRSPVLDKDETVLTIHMAGRAQTSIRRRIKVAQKEANRAEKSSSAPPKGKKSSSEEMKEEYAAWIKPMIVATKLATV